MKKIMKNRGSVLQITLIIFLILLSFISYYGIILSKSIKLYRESCKINEQRQIEIMLRKYYRQTKSESLLLSDTLRFDRGIIHYTVDPMGSYDLIETDIKMDNYQYHITMEINNDLSIKKYEYTY